MSLGIAGALLLGCGVSASSMTYYSRRYIGELALLTSPFQQPKLRISVLDFWGHRQASWTLYLSVEPWNCFILTARQNDMRTHTCK